MLYKMTGVEDQHKFCVPLNRETETIYYDKRMIVDANVLTEPRAWKVSKIERTATKGIAVITLYQDLFNPNSDYVELDENGLVIGMWADYFVPNGSEPEDTLPEIPEYEPEPEEKDYTASISFSGLSPSIKVGGSYKTFTMKYFDLDGVEISHDKYIWNFKLDGEEVAPGLLEIIYPNEENGLDVNKIKVKFLGGDYYYGSLLQVYNDDCSINIDIVGI